MKRRPGRRRPQRSPLAFVVLAIAVAVVVGAVALIVRGDTTPRPKHAAHHPASTSVAATTTDPTTPTVNARTSPADTASVSQTAPGASARTSSTTPTAAAPSQPSSSASASANASARAPSPPAIHPTATPADTAPRLAIIIDDCGQWLDTERGFLALPAALTLSVLPHVRYTRQIALAAETAGKGVMLHLPMEPRSGADPGPGRITTAMDDNAIAAQVRDDLAAVPLAAGVNNHEGSRATADDRVMRDVSAVLAERHVFFIDSRTGADTVAERDAIAAGVATARRDVFLDDVADVDATESQLRRAAGIAKANGSAIAIGHPRPTTLTAVRALLPELEKAGIVLVLARDLVR